MIEFVVREGPMFEAMIMNREINNPMYRSVQLYIRNVLSLYNVLHVTILLVMRCFFLSYVFIF